MKRYGSDIQRKVVLMYVEERLPTTIIARNLGIPVSSVEYILYRSGIKLRPQSEAQRVYYFNEHVFDVIDTPAKAYWLGFLWGDGTVLENRVTLMISEKDAEHLKKFARFIGTDAPIRVVDISNNVLPSGKKTPRRLAYLHVCSRHIVECLKRIGFSKRDEPPKIELGNLLSHFARGLLDSDGSIWLDKRKKGISRLCIEFSGGYSLLEWLRREINNTCGLPSAGGIKKHSQSNIHVLTYCGENAYHVGLLIYKDSTPETRLERKYLVFKEVVMRDE